MLCACDVSWSSAINSPCLLILHHYVIIFSNHIFLCFVLPGSKERSLRRKMWSACQRREREAIHKTVTRYTRGGYPPCPDLAAAERLLHLFELRDGRVTLPIHHVCKYAAGCIFCLCVCLFVCLSKWQLLHQSKFLMWFLHLAPNELLVSCIFVSLFVRSFLGLFLSSSFSLLFSKSLWLSLL